MSFNRRTLVLNSNYMPVSLWPLYAISANEAFVRYYTGSCQVVHWYDRKILTQNKKHNYYYPSVIVNPSHKNVHKSEVKLKKLTLYYRDHCCCSHCGTDLTLNNMTYEHVVPKSKGGEHSWENVVAACQLCNSKKGDEEPIGRWAPKRKPYVPSYFD